MGNRRCLDMDLNSERSLKETFCRCQDARNNRLCAFCKSVESDKVRLKKNTRDLILQAMEKRILGI